MEVVFCPFRPFAVPPCAYRYSATSTAVRPPPCVFYPSPAHGSPRPVCDYPKVRLPLTSPPSFRPPVPFTIPVLIPGLDRLPVFRPVALRSRASSLRGARLLRLMVLRPHVVTSWSPSRRAMRSVFCVTELAEHVCSHARVTCASPPRRCVTSFAV